MLLQCKIAATKRWLFKNMLSFRKATTLKVEVCSLLASFFNGTSLAANWTSCFTSARWACHWQPNGWQRRTAWWRTWKLWKRLALLPSSALTRQGPSRRTGWLLPTSGLIIKSTQLIPVKIKQVNMAVGDLEKGGYVGCFPLTVCLIDVNEDFCSEMKQTYLPATHKCSMQ